MQKKVEEIDQRIEEINREIGCDPFLPPQINGIKIDRINYAQSLDPFLPPELPDYADEMKITVNPSVTRKELDQLHTDLEKIMDRIARIERKVFGPA